MDYPVQLTAQLHQLLKSLRKSRELTQAELAERLGVVQSRVADIERNPGAVSVEQLMQVLAMLGAQVVVRDMTTDALPTQKRIEIEERTKITATASGMPTTGSKRTLPASNTPPEDTLYDEPKGQW